MRIVYYSIYFGLFVNCIYVVIVIDIKYWFKNYWNYIGKIEEGEMCVEGWCE